MQPRIVYYQGKNAPLHLPNPPQIFTNKPITNSHYIQLRQITFQEQGSIKTWDIANSHNSVAILLYNTTEDCFVFVRQFRVSVFLKNPDHGYVYELCAGLCDKEKPVEEIAKEEVMEECGYHIESKCLQKIAQFYNSVGMNGAIQNLFYALVTNENKKSDGGGKKEEGEYIQLIYVPREQIDEFLDDKRCPITQSLAFAILWFKNNQDNHL